MWQDVNMMSIDPRQLERWSKNVENYLNELAKHVNDLRKFQITIDYERQLQAAHEFISKLHSQSVSYTNLILVAGYAAFFTFWSQLHDDLPPLIFNLVGLLIIASLLCFISWEVTKMIWGNLSIRRVQAELDGAKPGPTTMAKFQEALTSFDRRSGKIWVWFLVPTITFGAGAGLLLLGFFTWRLLSNIS